MSKRRPGGRARSERASLDEVVTVRDLAAGGRGVARLRDGRTVFLRALPGDVVRLKEGRVRGRFVEAEAYDLLEASELRQPPVCGDQAACGGCDWMELSLNVQRSHKVEILRQSLLRVGKVAPERLGEEVPAVGGAGLGYRRRVRLHLVGRRLGFFAEGTRTLVEVERCHVCSPELWQAVLEVRALLADPERVRIEWLESVREVEIRVLSDAARPAVRLVLRAGGPEPLALKKELATFAFVQGTTEEAERHALIGDVYTLLPPGGFVQVNAEINARLIEEVLSSAAACGASSALDVFCGVGNFALPLAARGIQTLGVELAREATQHAQRAATLQGLPARFRAGPAERVLSELSEQGQRFDLVVVDPPREGAKGLGPLLAQLCERALVMISCDPVTLARDVADFERAGLHLTRTLALDMFPQTHHLEALVEFRRTKGRF